MERQGYPVTAYYYRFTTNNISPTPERDPVEIFQILDRINNNPLDVITTLLTIYRELLLLMIEVGPITTWELFTIM